jgi:glycosyltransferase involved in cell wall biosynthesis
MQIPDHADDRRGDRGPISPVGTIDTLGSIAMISVITVTLNAAPVLKECLASIASQEHVQLEHLIIDGGSTDGTLNLLRSWTHHPLNWISEPDRGISHAFNKGISKARGEFILILNADDRASPGALARAVAALETDPRAGFAFGHCRHREADGRTWLNRGHQRYFERMRFFMPDVNHPTMVIRRSAYELIGGYDEQWRLAMDYDWLARAEAVGIRGVLVDAVQAEMAMGGASDRHWRRAYAEARRIAILHGAPAVIAWIDHLGRLVKTSIRRTVVTIGARRLEQAVRRWRQRTIHGA